MTQPSNDTESRFDRDAAHWDENPVRRAMARAVARKIIDTVKPDPSMNTLEIGSGTGLVTMNIAPLVGHLTALDGSENMLAELGKKFESIDIKNISLRKVDLETNTLPGTGYDLIFTNMTFHHIADGNQLLEKIYTALAPGGILALSDLDTEDGTFHSDMEGVHHLGFDRTGMISAFERVGFKDCAIDTAHTLEKKNAQGVLKTFTLFLATGRKPYNSTF